MVKLNGRTTAAVLLATSLFGTGAAAAPKSLHPPSLVPGGKAPELLLIGTGDVIGYVDPCG